MAESGRARTHDRPDRCFVWGVTAIDQMLDAAPAEGMYQPAR